MSRESVEHIGDGAYLTLHESVPLVNFSGGEADVAWSRVFHLAWIMPCVSEPQNLSCDLGSELRQVTFGGKESTRSQK